MKSDSDFKAEPHVQEVKPEDETIDITNFIQKSANPCVVLFTLLFKALAIVSFFILGWFVSNSALIFVSIIVFNAVDFWIMKNVSGRILVGLRWWNEINDDGEEVTIYESDHEIKHSSIDTTVFWICLYSYPLFWVVFMIIEIIGLNVMWAIACGICFLLGSSNTIGYYQCSSASKGMNYVSDNMKYNNNN